MASGIPSLDVTTIPPPQRHPKIFQTFDALAPGESFMIINDHDPKPLLYQFQFERARAFDWNILEAGPRDFRVEIRKRRSPEFRTVSEYLEGDHRRLDEILKDVRAKANDGDFTGAAREFGEFFCGLNYHIEREERVLFPTFEQVTGMSEGGPTAVMRSEHAELRGVLEKTAAALEARDEKAFMDAQAVLIGILRPHNEKEEQVLYPACDRAAGGERERDELVRNMQVV